MSTLAHERVTESATAGEEQFGAELLWRVGAEALRRRLVNVRDQIVPVCAGDDDEAIHQMRVAIRRLRTMARLLGETGAFRRRRVAQLRRRLRPLARRLGAVRDLDILLQRLDAYECSGDEAMRAPRLLRDELLRRRDQALRRVRKTLRQPAMRQLVGHPRRTTRRLMTRSRAGRRLLVRQVAGSALWGHFESILGFADVVTDAASTERLHALRIACKQLRYALELFSTEDDTRAQALLTTLKETQDYLGELQDSVFAVALLSKMSHARKRDPLLGSFRASQEAQRDGLRQGVAPYWERLSGAPFRHELAALVGAL
jgi:CHAD domain-containing protein